MVSEPFRQYTQTQKIQTIDGVGVLVKWPTTFDDARIAIGRIGQDIRDRQYMQQIPVGLCMTGNNQIVITRAGQEPVRFNFMGPDSIANNFSIAMNYLSNLLALECSDNRSLFDAILVRRLGGLDRYRHVPDNRPTDGMV